MLFNTWCRFLSNEHIFEQLATTRNLTESVEYLVYARNYRASLAYCIKRCAFFVPNFLSLSVVKSALLRVGHCRGDGIESLKLARRL
ncbi:hypothetical protein MMAG44476_07861 [Mycolicibacterium mageritense DSM 44476 = CIP 104973]